MQLCHIFTFEGLKLQKKRSFWSILGQIRIQIMNLSQTVFFLIIMIVHRRKVFLHLNSLIERCPKFSKSMIQSKINDRDQDMAKKPDTLDDPDPTPDP